MASSSIITSINSALDSINSALDDELLLNHSDYYNREILLKKRKYILRNLKIFILCARKLGNDVHQRFNDNKNENGSLRSLLKTIEDDVCRYAPMLADFDASINFVRDISLKEKIDAWYITMSDYKRQSSSLTVDEIVEITDSISENQVDLHYTYFNHIMAEPMEALEEHVKFLTNFSRFVTKSGVEPRQIKDLLTLTEAAAIKVAHVHFLCWTHYGNEKWWKGNLKILPKKIKHIDGQVYETYNQALSYSKCSGRLHAPTQDMDDDSTIVMKNFVDSLIYILWDILRLDTCHVISLKNDLQVLYEGLRSLRFTLKLPNSIDEKTRDVIRVVVCDAGVLIYSFYQQNVEIDLSLKDLLERMKPFLAKVEEKVPQTSVFNTPKNFSGKRKKIKVKEASSTSNHVPSQKADSITTEVVGFSDEEISIVNRLTRGSKQLKVIAIVGMGGLGKTTLAMKVYNDRSVVRHFHIRAWRPVSQTLDKKALLLDLLNQIHLGKYDEKAKDELGTRLWRDLKGRRYLIFLDDIWTIEAWNSLQGFFPDDSTGSRIILTSRNLDSAPLEMLDQEPLLLRELDKNESLELLQRKLFPGEVWPSTLDDLGMQIVGKCKGLPLTIVIVAGLLAATEEEGWKKIVDGLSSSIVSNIEQCMNTLELSYKHLPDYLKPCFLYFGAFPEDQVVSVRRLIRLWIAEGFVRKSESESLENVAECYMTDLIGRSLIMVAQQRSIGGVKSCRIHDLLHGFCLKKAKDEYVFHLLKGRDEVLAFNEPYNLRRLCIHCKPEHFKESKLFCPRARSLRFFSQERGASIDISFVIHIFKLVTVLDLWGISLGNVFPSEIELLVQLRYLSIRGPMKVIPSSVGNLLMLETLIVYAGLSQVELPDTIWNLQKLKYVFIGGSGGGFFPIENLDNNSVLNELDRISGAVFSDWGRMEKQMRLFPNICKLKCKNKRFEKFQNIVDLNFLSRLQSLHMSHCDLRQKDMNFEFCLPANLKKLTLGGFGSPLSKISTIGKLPNLEVLKLLDYSFGGEKWEIKEGEFPKLRYLKLFKMHIVRWVASDDQFPCLQKLELGFCWDLEELPLCLEWTQTLEIIEVFQCSIATRSLVKHIEEEQESIGNSALKVIIYSKDDIVE